MFRKMIVKFEISKIFKKPGYMLEDLLETIHIPNFKKIYLFWRFFEALYNEKGVTSFFDLLFLGVPGIVEEN